MCVIFFAYDVHPRYRLILAANRDEFYERPAMPLGYWHDHPEILAGRDLKLMGTWMGITREGRFAVLTNFRDPAKVQKDAPSRGSLVADFLKSGIEPREYLQQIRDQAAGYNGFNLIVGDFNNLYYASNRGEWFRRLAPGIYGLSNHLLDTPWPKVSLGLSRFKRLVSEKSPTMNAELEEILTNRDIPPDDLLPDTGVGLVWERILAPIFISSPSYGTRCSSILTIEQNGYIVFKEIIWKQARVPPLAAVSGKFNFILSKNRMNA